MNECKTEHISIDLNETMFVLPVLVIDGKFAAIRVRGNEFIRTRKLCHL